MEKKRYEENAYVLDFLPKGKASFGKEFTAEPMVQMIGEEFFTLLEATVRYNAAVSLHDRLYIGKDKRDKVSHIIGRISYDELTMTAKSELPAAIEEIVKLHATKFIQFFNIAQSVTPRMHAFELLPGIGKKYMWQIIRERERKPFEGFEDLHRRTGVPDPLKLVVRRILEELSTAQKYHVFTRQF